MKLNVEEKIEELREKLSIVERESQTEHSKLYQMLKKGLIEIQLEQLERIRDRNFQVTLKLEVECTTFETKDFLIDEFDLTDCNTVNCAIKDFLKYDDNKESLFN
jgi:hypothetical protein